MPSSIARCRLVWAIVCGLGVGCSASAPSSAPETPSRAPIDVVELSASEARDRMAAGELTARALTQAYLDRIASIDDAGPMLNAVIEIDSTALEVAAERDRERAAGRLRGPLHGIPVLIKDNIDVAGLVTSVGSLALAHHRPARDAFLVTRLRDAGAIVLGKTNLSEWANFRSIRSTSGWSSRGGQTKNAYVLDRNPCGSSSGTGTAMAASLATIGVGTETDGSIICPASVSGLVGLKPTVGIISRRGLVPISKSQDTAGPMGRTVTDVALLMNALAGIDDADAASAPARNRIPTDYTSFLKNDALKGKRFGVVRQSLGSHPAVDASVTGAIEVLKAQGASVETVAIRGYESWSAPELEVLLYEFKEGINAYLGVSGSAIGSLEALIAWNRANAERVMPFFGQEIFERSQAKGPLTDPAYLRAKQTTERLAGREGLLDALTRDRLDALIAPSMSPAWPTDLILGDYFVGGSAFSMSAAAGTPSLTVPIGQTHGLPLGLTFMGRAYSEPDLLAFAYALEQSTRARRPPEYRATLPIPPDR